MMKYELKNPSFLTISDKTRNKIYYGPDQVWFTDKWRKKAGCGPTSAAFVTAYLAFTRPHLRPLYAPSEMEREEFLHHMNDVYEFVTPGLMGVNKVSIFTKGVNAFASSRNIHLISHKLDIERVAFGQREPSKIIAEFVVNGLKSDCPISFLALSNGKESKLQNWHWITITSAEIEDTEVLVHASDEGHEIVFDLQLWYKTTNLSGGLVYFTEALHS